MAKKDIRNGNEPFVPMLLGDADIEEKYEGKLSLRFIFKNFKISYLFKKFSEIFNLEATYHRFGSIFDLVGCSSGFMVVTGVPNVGKTQFLLELGLGECNFYLNFFKIKILFKDLSLANEKVLFICQEMSKERLARWAALQLAQATSQLTTKELRPHKEIMRSLPFLIQPAPSNWDQERFSNMWRDQLKGGLQWLLLDHAFLFTSKALF